MEKGYYVCKPAPAKKPRQSVAIHNKNGQGLLLNGVIDDQEAGIECRNPQ